jgi:sigma-B regulation protein RsbU (phosphoserine phosphatase)
MRAAMQAVYCSGLILSRLVTNSPARILEAISPIVKKKTDPKTFMSALIGVYNANSKVLTYANAGHCPPVLKRKGKITELRNAVSHLPLGVREAGHYVQYEQELLPGDIVIAYSDGLTEAVSLENKRLGEEKLFNFLREMPTNDMSAEQLSREIKRFIQDFSNYQMADDTTVICLRVA